MVDSHAEMDEAALRATIEDFFHGFRAFTALPDALLAERGLGRTHHRILYFTRRDPGISVGSLLAILGISKQAAHGPLRALERQGLISSTPSPQDGRVRELRVTDEGAALEQTLTTLQMRVLADAFAEAGPRAASGWRAVMRALRPG